MPDGEYFTSQLGKGGTFIMGYQVGDKVIHWNYGFGEIVQLDVKYIQERQTPYFVVRIRDFSIWVVADETAEANLRLPTSAGDFENLFAILHSPGEPLPNDRFERKKLLVQRMRDGKLASVCGVVRDLTLQRTLKKLNDDDRSMLERAKNFLLAEWTFSLSVPMAKAHSELGQLLGE